MEKYIFIFCITILSSCGSNNNREAEEIDENVNPECNIFEPVNTYTTDTVYSAPTQSVSEQSEDIRNPNANISNADYKSGYNFGFSMGKIAAETGEEYNPYLPVGPNVRTYSIEYRQGYAAGYSEGYENGQQSTGSAIYSDDDYSDDDEVYYEDDY